MFELHYSNLSGHSLPRISVICGTNFCSTGLEKLKDSKKVFEISSKAVPYIQSFVIDLHTMFISLADNILKESSNNNYYLHSFLLMANITTIPLISNLTLKENITDNGLISVESQSRTVKVAEASILIHAYGELMLEQVKAYIINGSICTMYMKHILSVIFSSLSLCKDIDGKLVSKCTSHSTISNVDSLQKYVYFILTGVVSVIMNYIHINCFRLNYNSKILFFQI